MKGLSSLKNVFGDLWVLPVWVRGTAWEGSQGPPGTGTGTWVQRGRFLEPAVGRGMLTEACWVTAVQGGSAL